VAVAARTEDSVANGKPQRVRLTAERLVGGGVAIAHALGATWMLAGALDGEQVDAEAVVERAGVVHGRTLEVVHNPHPARLTQPCPHAAFCGGCDWPHVDPIAGSRLKAAVAAGAARASSDLATRLAEAPVRSSPPSYRLRSRLHWDPRRGHLGFYKPRTWETVDITGCRITSPRLTNTIAALEEALAGSCPEAADLEWLEDLRGATAVAALRPARSGAPEVDPDRVPVKTAAAALVDGFHVLTRSGRLQPVWGAQTVTMDLPVSLKVPIGAFFQVNRHLVPWLFRRVQELVGESPKPVWDLHAGVGFLAAAALAAAPRELTLVEPFRPAARAAAANLPEARVAIGRSAEAYLARHPSLPRDAVALTDPPRAGLSRSLRRQLAAWHPARVLMLACDPATWARDAAALIAAGYSLTHLELVDLFPSTHHVEILAVLESR